MRQLSDSDALNYGISSIHHAMDNGELRFRLVSESGSSYIRTQSTINNGWQNSHIHYEKTEFYIVEKGCAYLALLIDGKVQIIKFCENDSFSVAPGTAHNVLLSDHAVLHTVKYGAQGDDWHACPELDKLLADFDCTSALHSQ